MLYPRIIGLETEYGCLVEEELSESHVLRRIRDWFFDNRHFGLIDLHHRGWDEPPGNGGFLYNGGRLYIDMGHIEFCTPECAGLRDVVRYDRAGDLLLLKAVDELELAGRVQFFRNNIDHYTQATFGCHENYLIDRSAPLTEENVLSLLAFQTLRVLFTGAGRAGAAHILNFRDGANDLEVSTPYQISQRADHIENDFYQWVQHNRAIVNTRDVPLADPNRYRRLHVLHGDTNVMPSNLFLKIGATSLVLDLLEEDALPDIVLAHAVSTLKQLSRQTEGPWYVRTADGREADAVELIRSYYDLARDEFHGRDRETDAVLDLWHTVLRGLNGKPDTLVGFLDWVGKKHLLEKFVESEGVDWNHPWLYAQDLEYHHIDPQRSLGLALANRDGLWEPTELESTLTEPPSDSRASKRSSVMRKLQSENRPYFVDWDRIEVPEHKVYRLSDPYNTQSGSVLDPITDPDSISP